MTTLTKSALKSLEGKTLTWFLIELKGKALLFGVDKKQSNPAKFKKPSAVKKYLTQLGVENTDAIKENSGLVCGTVTVVGEKVQFVISFKVNGGSKSMVKANLGDLKNICPTFQLGKSAKDDSMAAVDAEVDQEDIAVPKSQDPNAIKLALKVVKWWIKSAKSQLVEAEAAPDDHEDFLEDLQRRLIKYSALKCYNLFRDGKVLAAKRPKDFDLEKANVLALQKRIKAALAKIVTDNEQEDANTTQMASEAIEAMVDDLDLIAELMALSDIGTADFKKAAAQNRDTLLLLWKDFSNRTKDLVLLKDVLGSGSWAEFFVIANKFERA